MREARGSSQVRFFVAGVPKAGTTALCRFLGQHGEIFMCPIKEPTFFAAREAQVVRTRLEHSRARKRSRARALAGRRDLAPSRRGFALEWPHYEALFRDVRDQRRGRGRKRHLLVGARRRACDTREVSRRALRVDPSQSCRAILLAVPCDSLTKPLRTLGDCIASGSRVARVGASCSMSAAMPRTSSASSGALDASSSAFTSTRTSARILGAACSRIFAFLGVDPDHPVDVSMRINRAQPAPVAAAARGAYSPWVRRAGCRVGFRADGASRCGVLPRVRARARP